MLICMYLCVSWYVFFVGERARNRNAARPILSDDDESAGDWDSDNTESTREEDKIYPLTEVTIIIIIIVIIVVIIVLILLIFIYFCKMSMF